MFDLPVVTSYGVPGAVVGADPWDDDDDATYASGGATPSEFTHLVAAIDPTAVGGDAEFIFRVSATIAGTATAARFVANLYPPGWSSGDGGDPALNFTAGPNPVYVQVPVADGTPQDIPVAIYDWATETPATAAQIVDYFAAGGTLMVQPNAIRPGGGVGSCQITIHRIGFASVEVEEPYRRIFPVDRGRNWPPSKQYGRGGRRGGGYL